MATIHLISHTHWDREWYLPFQVFRLKLVHLVDHLLGLLAAAPDYRYFMLDGQTIVLDDYLALRPEREDALRDYVKRGRLLIGPWHVMPDEFLVSPESLVRNLLQGDRTARRFGPKMMVGYTPDPFGHIGQLPQILRGFGIGTAALWRGLADEPHELWWEAPDGARVLLAYLRDSYANAAGLPVAACAGDDSEARQAYLGEVARLRDASAPYSAAGHLLFMQGTDHMEPQPATPAAIACARDRLDGDEIIHSTLPAYFQAVEAALHSSDAPIPVVRCELRSSKRAPLLPNVLSSRMWIKQRNHACETWLEKWAEPFSAWANLLETHLGLGRGGATGADMPAQARVANPAPILRHAWRLLMECHPHDSICGCSIDQVHDEMRPRFDQVEQIAEQITRQSLASLAGSADTRPGPDSPLRAPRMAVVVFNAGAGPRSGVVRLRLPMRAPAGRLAIVDEAYRPVPFNILGSDTAEVAYEVLDRDGLTRMVSMVQGGSAGGLALIDLDFHREDKTLRIEALLGEASEPNYEALGRGLEQLPAALADPTITTFIVHAVSIETTVELLAHDVPSHGYRTFWLEKRHQPERPLALHATRGPAGENGPAAPRIENEFLLVEADPVDATLTVTDKRTGVRYTGLNRLLDGGDAGDEYNYAPPAHDPLLSLNNVAPVGPVRILRREEGTESGAQHRPLQAVLEITYTLPIPAGLAPDRKSRTGEAPLTVRSVVSVAPGVARVDIVTELDNRARDHRVRVRFPAPFAVQHAYFDGHYQVVRRATGRPASDATWVEQPRPETAQRAWTDVSDGAHGLMIAAKGLPEVEILTEDGGAANGDSGHSEGSSAIALTLLRCVGWLSRDDFATRRGHAGPGLPTPGAQMIGSHRFEYSIIPHRADWLSSGAYLEAYAFDAPMQAVAVNVHEGRLPPAASLLRAEPAAFVITAVKTGEDGEGLVVRGYNIGSQPTEVTLTPWLQFGSVARVRLDESEESALPQNANGSVTFTARSNEIVTIKFR